MNWKPSRRQAPPEMRVALHADDLGFSPAISGGILDAFRHGLLTGASVMANGPDAAAALAAWTALEAERQAGSLPSLSSRSALDDPPRPFDLGVHLNLSQGRPLTGAGFPAALRDGEGSFAGLATFARLMLPSAGRHAAAVRRELDAQIGFVRDHGLRPVRLDGHQYCELTPLVGEIVVDLAARHGIGAVRVAREPGAIGTLLLSRGAAGWTAAPGAVAKRVLAAGLRRRAARAGLRHADWFFGSVTAGRVGRVEMERFLALATGRGGGLVEIGLHPALPAAATLPPSAGAWHDPLAATRPDERRWLTSAALAACFGRMGARLGRLA